MVRGPILAGRFLSACEPPNGAGPYPDHAFYPKLTHFYPQTWPNFLKFYPN